MKAQMSEIIPTIIPREQIPRRREKRRGQYQEWYKLTPKGDDTALRITVQSPKCALNIAHAFRAANHHAEKSGRALPYPGLKVLSRGNEIFLWKEVPKQDEQHH